jgi:hypothetical protein
MNRAISKREFLRVGVGGTTAVVLASLFRAESLFAGPAVLPRDYLQSSVHHYWMKLSYNQGRESRRTRQRLGVVLRHLGTLSGQGQGFNFALHFDRAVEAAYRRFKATGIKPGSLFELVQSLYDDPLYQETGETGGRILFGTLLALLRGRDGTELGQEAYQEYLSYRKAALVHKNAYKHTADPQERAALRQARKAALDRWALQLASLANLYARRELALPAGFLLRGELFDGLNHRLKPAQMESPQLRIVRAFDQAVVSWRGDARLQGAPTLSGPWTDLRKASPASVSQNQPAQFFRTVVPEPGI